MNQYPEAAKIQAIIAPAERIVIVQADNPDGDSLGSALALEQILHEMGKEPLLQCGVSVPGYLTHLPGWDRVDKDIPHQFDASIIVDTSSEKLLASLDKSGQRLQLAAKPCVVLDHHAVTAAIPYATVVCNQPVVATGELIYELALQLGWPLNAGARNMLATSIMADSLGLTAGATSARSIHIIGELVESGVRLAQLENNRRNMMRKSPELVHYKGQLLQRVEYHFGNRIATVTIPWSEIEKYSPAYNPSVLVLDDMRLSENTLVAIAFKLYPNGKITAKIRCNYGWPIAAELAEHFGGGGHAYASGFKVTDGRPFEDIKRECLEHAAKLLDGQPQQEQPA